MALAVATAVIGTTVSAAQSLVMPMLMDGTIEDQAAAIFTYQNQVSASLAQTIGEAEAHGLPLLDALYTVEEQLNEACAPLQEAGRRHMEGEDLSSLLQIAVYNAMDGCAAKSEEVAYYVRLARSYSTTMTGSATMTDAAEDVEAPVRTAWD